VEPNYELEVTVITMVMTDHPPKSIIWFHHSLHYSGLEAPTTVNDAQWSLTFTRPTVQSIVLALNALIDPIVFSSYHTGPLVASSHFV